MAANQGSRTIDLADAVEMTVGDVMIKWPKTLPAEATMADVRAAFERPAVRTVLLADGERFAGAIEREGVPDGASDDAPARDHVEASPLTVTPDTPMPDAVSLLESRGEQRLIVLGPDGVTLLGLLCANRTGSGFCVR